MVITRRRFATTKPVFLRYNQLQLTNFLNSLVNILDKMLSYHLQPPGVTIPQVM